MDSFDRHLAELTPRRPVTLAPTPTPLWDRLNDALSRSWMTLATFHGQTGGEWDILRNTPLRRRQKLTGAGLMARDGAPPDVFADMLKATGFDFRGLDPIEWFIHEASAAIDERRNAASKDRRNRLAVRGSYDSYYSYRTAWCRARGYPSLYAYRQARRWE